MINKINKLCNVLDSGMCYGKGIIQQEEVFALEGDVKKSGPGRPGKSDI